MRKEDAAWLKAKPIPPEKRCQPAAPAKHGIFPPRHSGMTIRRIGLTLAGYPFCQSPDTVRKLSAARGVKRDWKSFDKYSMKLSAARGVKGIGSAEEGELLPSLTGCDGDDPEQYRRSGEAEKDLQMHTEYFHFDILSLET